MKREQGVPKGVQLAGRMTPEYAQILTFDALDFLAKLHPMQRLGEVKEIVDAVLYLDNAGFVTGEVLRVDGGQHAGRW